jgi:hypothetical protein
MLTEVEYGPFLTLCLPWRNLRLSVPVDRRVASHGCTAVLLRLSLVSLFLAQTGGDDAVTFSVGQSRYS